MTEVATPPPATERACPRCGASLAADQEWCLSCGTAVGTRIAPTPRWRVPIALVGTLVALIAAALILALVELSGDPQPIANAPSTTPTATPAGDGGSAAPVVGETPTPAATAVPSATPTPTTTPDPGVTQPPDEAPTTGELAEWPADKTGWTAVLASTKSRSEAEAKARAAAGSEVGVLRSDDFSSLRKGYWVVFSGQYDSRSAAETAAEDASSDAYARRIVAR